MNTPSSMQFYVEESLGLTFDSSIHAFEDFEVPELWKGDTMWVSWSTKLHTLRQWNFKCYAL